MAKPEASALDDCGTIATLIRGLYFDYNGTVWNREKEGKASHRVDAATADYLARTAVDVVGMLDGADGPELITKPKFAFAEAGAS